MLSTIRNNKKSIIGIVLAGFLAIVMMGFGIDTGCNGTQAWQQVVIRVDGHELSLETYERELIRVTELYQQQLGQNYAAMKSFLNIEQRAVDSLIEERIGEDFTKDLGLSASTPQMEVYLAQTPFFQRNGLTRQTYDMFLRAQGMSGEQFEEKLKNEIAERQFHSMLSDLNRPTDEELKSVFREKNTKLEFEYITLRPADFEKKVDVSDEARLKQYFESYADKYRKPRSVRFNYVTFEPSEFLSKTEVTPEDLQHLYLQKQNQFSEPKLYKVRRIVFNKGKEEASALEQLVTGEKGAAPKPADEAKKAKATAVVERLKNGENFEAVAKEASEDQSAKVNGGDIGWVTGAALDKEVRPVIDRMEVGKYSDVIETAGQYVVVFLEDFKDRRVKPLEEVRDQLENELRMQDAPEYARVEAENFYRRWQDSAENRSLSLADYAKKENRTVKIGEKLLEAKEDPAGAPGLTAKVIGRSPGDRDAVHAGDFDYVVEVVETKDAYLPDFAELKAQVVKDFTATESKLIAKREADKARAELAAPKNPKSLAEIARENSVEVKSLGPVSRGEPGNDPVLMMPGNREMLFALNEASPVAPSVLGGSGGELIIARLKSRTLPDEAELASKVASLRTEEAKSADSRISTFVSESLRASADVWVSPKLLENRGSPLDTGIDL